VADAEESTARIFTGKKKEAPEGASF